MLAALRSWLNGQQRTVCRWYTSPRTMSSMEQATSWHGFATAIVAGLKTRGAMVNAERVIAIDSEAYPTKAIRPKNSRLDTTRLTQVFGIIPPLWSTALDAELDLLVDSLDHA